jgi:hypothetical protein
MRTFPRVTCTSGRSGRSEAGRWLRDRHVSSRTRPSSFRSRGSTSSGSNKVRGPQLFWSPAGDVESKYLVNRPGDASRSWAYTTTPLSLFSGAPAAREGQRLRYEEEDGWVNRKPCPTLFPHLARRVEFPIRQVGAGRQRADHVNYRYPQRSCPMVLKTGTCRNKIPTICKAALGSTVFKSAPAKTKS